MRILSGQLKRRAMQRARADRLMTEAKFALSVAKLHLERERMHIYAQLRVAELHYMPEGRMH